MPPERPTRCSETQKRMQLERVAGQRQAPNDANSPRSNSVPLDLVSAVLAAAESSEGLDSPRESSERHTTRNAEEPTRRVGSTEKDTIGSQEGSYITKETDADNTQENADLLASKWLSTGQLATLAKETGLIYKKGQFSSKEHQSIIAAIESYRERSSLDLDELERVIYQKQDSRNDGFWTQIASVVPNRPLMAVYLHVRRSYHPYGKLGPWCVSEDNDLIKAVAKHGEHWKAVSAAVGRSDTDCRDRYRNHIKHSTAKQKGRWSKAEEDELTRIVNRLNSQDGITDSSISWGEVSIRMNHKRGRQQCAAKWLELKQRSLNGGRKRTWRRDHASILVKRIREMSLVSDADIDWGILQAEFQNVWSTLALRRNWVRLKSGVDEFRNKTHQEIITDLHAQYSSPA